MYIPLLHVSLPGPFLRRITVSALLHEHGTEGLPALWNESHTRSVVPAIHIAVIPPSVVLER